MGGCLWAGTDGRLKLDFEDRVVWDRWKEAEFRKFELFH